MAWGIPLDALGAAVNDPQGSGPGEYAYTAPRFRDYLLRCIGK
jgi:hypothetical protein